MGEFDYIRWVRERAARSAAVTVGIGDDCAVLRGSDKPLLVTTDMLLEGSHFRLAEVGPERVGRKALAVNLSDIAAMGGRPVAAVASVGLPRRGARRIAEALFLGMQPLADAFATPLVGGDTNTWDGPLVLSLTVFGEPGPCGPILRSGARPGDWLLVTGPLGGSIAGKHFDFTPRVAEGLALQHHCTPHAMIDISDGLAADVGHLAEESGCSATLVAEAIPISAAARQMNDGRAPLDHALADGEDFELAFAVSAEEGCRLIATQPLARITLVKVGECETGSGLFLVETGKRRPLPPRGYEHCFEDPS